MKKIFAAVSLAAVLSFGAVAAVAAPDANITFRLISTGGHCQLEIISSKEISNYTVNGVKTEGIATTTVTLNVQNGDVIVVKSGTTTKSFTVSGCPGHVPGGDDHDHNGDGSHDGVHPGEDHNGDGLHGAGDHAPHH